MKTQAQRQIEEDFEEPIEELLRSYVNARISTGYIATMLGVSRRTIWNWLEQYHIPTRGWLKSTTLDYLFMECFDSDPFGHDWNKEQCPICRRVHKLPYYTGKG